ncbi:MAG: hypothetical protein ABL999_15000 [Pyrinomonadaceae bacterium]
MNFQKTFSFRLVLLSLFAVAVPFVAFGQGNREQPVVQVTLNEKPKPAQAIAGRNNLYCAGYIQSNAISTANKIIGGQDEAEKYLYAQNDYLYINMGNDKGVNVGDVFAVVRPRGGVKSKWTTKDVGFYVQEVGAVEVVNVKREVSVVRVKTSCDNFLLGDLVELVPIRTSPVVEQLAPLNRFGDPSGKATGRILMGRDGHEMMTRDQIAYVDLGADDSVKIGDRLTVFRPLEKGNLFLNSDREGVSSRDYGFESDVYKGGKFSNQSARKTGDKAQGQEVRTRDARNDRPKYLRKVVGEAVVLNVKERTATVVITRTGQEIHTGDWVEIQ